MNTYRQAIRVIYPQESGGIALRTDENWDIDVGAVGRRGGTTRSDRNQPALFLFLIGDGATVWSRGENYFATATSEAPLDVYPFFREDTRCSVWESMPPLASPSGH
jgi:hypothetical protein